MNDLVNNVAAHGIPDTRELEPGDIINIDITVFKDGFHGDCSDTFPVGDIDPYAAKLIDISRECLGNYTAFLVHPPLSAKIHYFFGQFTTDHCNTH